MTLKVTFTLIITILDFVASGGIGVSQPHLVFIIDDLFEATIKPVLDELKEDSSASGWDDWVAKWSKFSLRTFLENGDVLNEKGLRPWPNAAIEAYRVGSNRSQLNDRFF